MGAPGSPEEEKSVEETPEPPPPEEAPAAVAVEEAEPTEEELVEEELEEEGEEEEEEEELPPPKPQKKRYGGIIALVIALIILLVWTLLTPEVMTEEGDVYVTSPTYANLGNYTGERDIWAGKMTWGLSFNGSASAAVGQPTEYRILLTKVNEEVGNFWLKGTSVKLQNVSIFNEDGTILGWTKEFVDHGFGISGTVSVTFPQAGMYTLYASVKFLVYEAMLIGYLPLESVRISEAYFDVRIAVS